MSDALFYNGKTYSADSFSDWLKKFFTTGIFNGDMPVTAVTGKMQVRVGTGYCNIEGKVMMFDADTILTVSSNTTGAARTDHVVVERNDIDRVFTLKLVSTEPVQDLEGQRIYQLPLADITVPNHADAITAADISDRRDENLVTGTVDKLDFSGFQTQFNGWFTEAKASYTSDEADFKRGLEKRLAALDQFTEESESKFDNWFSSLQSTLSGDVAANLTREMLSNRLLLTDLGRCVNITLPASGWQPYVGSPKGYAYRVEVPASGVTDKMIPLAVANDPEEALALQAAGVAPIAETTANGSIRFFGQRGSLTAPVSVTVFLRGSAEIPTRVEEKGLLFDRSSTGLLIPAGEIAPDESIFTFEGAEIGDSLDMSIGTRNVPTLTITKGVGGSPAGSGEHLIIRWSGNDTTQNVWPEVRLRLAKPAPSEQYIGFSASSKRQTRIILRLYLYECEQGTSLGTAGREIGQKEISLPAGIILRHYRISLADILTTVSSPMTELRLCWENVGSEDADGDYIIIDNIGYFETGE